MFVRGLLLYSQGGKPSIVGMCYKNKATGKEKVGKKVAGAVYNPPVTFIKLWPEPKLFLSPLACWF